MDWLTDLGWVALNRSTGARATLFFSVSFVFLLVSCMATPAVPGHRRCAKLPAPIPSPPYLQLTLPPSPPPSSCFHSSTTSATLLRCIMSNPVTRGLPAPNRGPGVMFPPCWSKGILVERGLGDGQCTAAVVLQVVETTRAAQPQPHPRACHMSLWAHTVRCMVVAVCVGGTVPSGSGAAGGEAKSCSASPSRLPHEPVSPHGEVHGGCSVCGWGFVSVGVGLVVVGACGLGCSVCGGGGGVLLWVWGWWWGGHVSLVGVGLGAPFSLCTRER